MDLIISVEIIKSDLIDRMKVDLTNRINKTKTELIKGLLAYPCCSGFY